jgi:hypothetical protein
MAIMVILPQRPENTVIMNDSSDESPHGFDTRSSYDQHA